MPDNSFKPMPLRVRGRAAHTHTAGRGRGQSPEEYDIDSPSITRTEVIELSAADLSEIHDLRVRAADYFEEAGEAPPTPESFQADLDDLPDGYSRCDELVYRAYRDGRLGGYAEVLRGFEQPDQWIVGIALVDPAVRSSGIGHAMVNSIVADALTEQVRTLAAGVIASRERSISFWRREGFVNEVRRRPITIADSPDEVVRLERDLRQG